ncbi:MAG: hypothetical protein AB7G08_31970 [Hyphomicrobiaceae bacterium]
MANKEQPGNREKRKPKKEKPKTTPQASSFSGATTKSAAGQKKQPRALAAQLDYYELSRCRAWMPDAERLRPEVSEADHGH